MSIDVASQGEAGLGASGRLTAMLSRMDWRTVLALVVAGAFALHLATPLASDTSWLITVCERMLGGEALYRDINELNPPMSAWLYMPWVALGRASGIAPEFLVTSAVFLAALGATALSARILERQGLLQSRSAWWFALTFALLVAPVMTFSEREHLAVIALLPMLALTAARASGGRPTLVEQIVAGLGAGLTMTIKPHFALAVLAPVVVASLMRRSWRPLLSLECVVAGCVVVAYAGAIFLVYPDYVTETAPRAAAYYAANRLPLIDLVLKPWCVAAALAVAAVTLRDGLPKEPLDRVVAAGVLAFFAVYLIQGKGWAYHLLPAVALTMLLVALSLSRAPLVRPAAGSARATAGHGALIVALSALAISPVCETGARIFIDRWMLPGLVEPHLGAHEGRPPRIALLDEDLAYGSPLHRTLGAELVNRGPSLWMAGNALDICGRDPAEERLKTCRQALAAERAALLEDLERRPPDVIIAGYKNYDWLEWARREPKIAAILDRYRVVEDHDGTLFRLRILARCDRSACE